MPLIPAVEQKPETKVVSFPLEKALEGELRLYMKFVNAPNVGYIFNRALEYLLNHDKDYLKSKEQHKPTLTAMAR